MIGNGDRNANAPIRFCKINLLESWEINQYLGMCVQKRAKVHPIE